MSLLRKASIVTTPTSYENGKILSVKPSVVLGDELVVNGDFATDSDWILGTGWSISNGKLLGTLSNSTNAYQAKVLEAGKIYQITYEISNYSQGGVRFQLAGGGGTVDGASNSSNGIFTEKLKATVNHSSIRFRSLTTDGGFTASIENVSVKEVIDADFDFTRNSSATRVNSQGLIEDITGNLPRIDYNGGVGHWLFEPQSTNTATYSNDFTQGDIFVSSSTPQTELSVATPLQAISPDGTNNAWLLKDDNSGGTGVSNLRYAGTSLNSNDFNIVSVFVKKALTNNFIALLSANFDTSANGTSWFNISNGSLGTIDSDHTAKIEDYGNDWYRCSITFKTTTDTSGAVRIILASTDGSTDVSLDGTNGSYLFGLQCESSATQNYATSYTPTNGSTATRLADTASGAGSSDLINSTEGVLYAEVAALVDAGENRIISLSNGNSLNNSIRLYYHSSSSYVFFQKFVNGVRTTNISTTSIVKTNFNKIAIRYNSTEINVFLNGVNILNNADVNVFAPNTLNSLDFNQSSTTYPFFGKTKCVAVFKEALTDAELTCLTTI